MKKLIAFACTALLFASCQKEQSALPPEGVGLHEGTTKSGNIVTTTLTCVGCDSNGENCTECDCWGHPTNCLRPVVISQLHRQDMDTVFVVLATRVQSQIKTTFTAKRTVLDHYLATKDIDAVISGTARASTEPGPNDSRFILIRDSHGNVTAAYPLE